MVSTAPEPLVVPSRFRAAPRRSLRLGAPLRTLARVGAMDDDLMERIGAGMMTCDEVGARLAAGMRVGDPVHGKVSMKALHELLEHGPGEGTHPALVEFYEAVTPEPDWVDWDLLEEGQRVFGTWGRNAADVLLQLSLMGGYRFAGPPDLLVMTGGLTGQAARRRLAETQLWTTEVARRGTMARHQVGWRLTLHVRAMHAVVNHTFLHNGRWDVEANGLPINDSDTVGTLGLFDGVPLLGVRTLGVPVSRSDSRAVMHLWKYVGWLMGVPEEFLVDSERERHRINWHVLQAQGGQTEAGRQLCHDLIALQSELFDGPFGKVRGWLERERVLSMLTVLLGPISMRELHLPVRPPWAMVTAQIANFVRYRILGRGPGGGARLDRAAARFTDDILARYYQDGSRELGRIKP